MHDNLARVRPVGWLEERSKLEDMGDASLRNCPHLIGAESWQVKMRMINQDLVLPRQVIKQKISMPALTISPEPALP